jgi:hypothetical protein
MQGCPIEIRKVSNKWIYTSSQLVWLRTLHLKRGAIWQCLFLWLVTALRSWRLFQKLDMSPELALCHHAQKNIKIAKIQLTLLREKLPCLDSDDLLVIESIKEQLDGAINHIEAYYVTIKNRPS